MNPRFAAIQLFTVVLTFGLLGCSSGSDSGDGADGTPPISNEPPAATPDTPEIPAESETPPVVADPVETDTPPDLAAPEENAPADDQPAPDPSGVISTDDVRPFRPDSPYADVLKDCVLVNTIAASCTAATLPFIGQVTPQPTVDDVLNRVLITHDWMGQRFAEVLAAAPSDLLSLFASATSIVIGSEVRPSFYTALNGGIQLDPAFLWQSVEEKRTISISQDFRTDFGAALQFDAFRRGIINGERATRFFSLRNDSTREFADLQLNIMSLLYHELGHANDFLPANAIAELDSEKKVIDALVENQRFWLSPQLESTLPLNSQVVKTAAGVRFGDDDADEQIAALTSEDMGLLFADDGSLDFYSYNTIREDFATLLEYSMMRKNYALELNFAFANKIEETDDTVCEDYIVGWGVRNRLANPVVAQRARLVVENVYGQNSDNSEFFDTGLGTEVLMTPGVDWCTNNVPAPILAANVAASTFKATAGTGHRVSLFQLNGDRALR